ncbi:MAG: hypothetical protein ACI9BW_001016 [Gammaproteobacteria bacterium]|jgi:hypothetical protein
MRLTFLAFVCVAALCVQLGGQHAHANSHGVSSGLHGMHVHSGDVDGHDHSADVDVPLLGLAAVSLTLTPIIVAASPTLASVEYGSDSFSAVSARVLYVRHRLRWRPPLRAPPLPL